MCGIEWWVLIRPSSVALVWEVLARRAQRRVGALKHAPKRNPVHERCNATALEQRTRPVRI